MNNHNIYVAYAIENNSARVAAVAIDSRPAEATTIDIKGDITIGDGDQANIHFRSDTEGWRVSQVQIREHGQSWGTPLSASVAADYPGVDASNGVLLADEHGNASLIDANKQASDIDYRVSFTDGNGTVITDPRIKDRGGAL